MTQEKLLETFEEVAERICEKEKKPDNIQDLFEDMVRILERVCSDYRDSLER